MSVAAPPSGTTFDSQAFRAWVDSVTQHANTQELRIFPIPSGGTDYEQAWLKVTGSTEINPNKWDYDYVLVVWDSATDDFIETTITQASTGYTTARNSLEKNNPADLTAGTGFLAIGPELPLATGTMVPFGSTSGQEAFVPCWLMPTTIEGVLKIRPVFSQTNSIVC